MYVITGGAGFLGSATIWYLNTLGIDNILVVDNLGTSEKWKNLVGLCYEDYIHKDIFIQHVRQNNIPWKIKGIVHLGACSSTTERDAHFLMENNFHYSRDICLYALEHDIRFINASSASTYGDGNLGFDDAPHLLTQWQPLNMYGYSKHLMDLWLMRHKLLDRVVSLKFFNVYGPNEYHKDAMRSVVCKAYTEIQSTGILQLFRSTTQDFEDGEQMRDFVYVKDCVKIITWLLQNAHVGGIYNVGTGKARTWNALAQAIFAAMHIPMRIKYIDMPDTLRGKYQNFTEARMDNLLAMGCPACTLSLEDGVSDYVQNYLCTEQYLLADKFKAKM